MTKIRLDRKLLLSAIFAIWCALALAAVGSMFYSIWWKRDRELYSGKTTREKREVALGRAGLNAELVLRAHESAVGTPIDMRYRPLGDDNDLSYVKYLLAPRIPDKGSSFVLDILAKDDDASPGNLPAEAPVPWALILSVPAVLALGWALSLILKVKLSVPEAVAAGSLVVMLAVLLSKLVTGSANPGMSLVAAGAIAAAVAFAMRLMRRAKGGSAEDPTDQADASDLNHYIRFACWTVLIGSVALSFLSSVVTVPDDWDAWAIWGVKAKVLALGHGPLEDVTHFSHPDYPLLWPSLWAFAGWCGGGWEEQWSRGWGPVLMLLCAWEAGLLARERVRRGGWGLLTAAIIASIPMLPIVASWSYAEAPLWLMMVCCYRMITRWRDSDELRYVVLAGLFATAAAYTKNEGVLFGSLAALWFTEGPPRKWRALAAYAVVPLVLYGPWVWWVREHMGLDARATRGLSLSWHTLQTAIGRIPDASARIAGMWADPTLWGAVLVFAVAAAIVIAARGGAPGRHDAMVPVLMIGVFLVIVLCHIDNLAWQIATSWNRLTLQALVPLVAIVMSNPVWNPTGRRSGD